MASSYYISAGRSKQNRAGLTVPDSDLALLKSTVIAGIETVCLLADSSRLHRVDFRKFAGFNYIDILITGAESAARTRLR